MLRFVAVPKGCLALQGNNNYQLLRINFGTGKTFLDNDELAMLILYTLDDRTYIVLYELYSGLALYCMPPGFSGH